MRRLYESVLILSTQLSEEQVRGCFGEIEEILKKHDAKLVKKTDWGRKSLGFRIKKQSDGWYFVAEFEASPSKVADIRYAFRLADFLLFSSIFVKPKQKSEPVQKAAA